MTPTRSLRSPFKVWTASAALALGGCSQLTIHATADFHRTVPPAAIIELHNTAGEITVAPWNKPEIGIDARRRAATIGGLASTVIRITHNANRAVIDSEFGANFENRDVNYTIHAPAGTELDLHQTAGDITVTGWTGSITTGQTAGDVTVSLARLSNGQQVTIRQTAGDTKLTLPKNADARIVANASVGSIDNNLNLTSNQHLTSAHASGQIGSGAAPVDVETSTGSITINGQ